MHLVISSSSNVGNVAGNFCREDGAHWVPEVFDIFWFFVIFTVIPETTIHTDPIPVGVAVVHHGVPTIPAELVVEEHVGQEELDSK